MGKTAELEERKKRALRELEKAIGEHGIEIGKKVVRASYADIPRSTWYRWLSEANIHPVDDAIRAAKKVMKDAGHLMPAPPSPAMIAKNPVEGKKKLDFIGRFEALYADAELLRTYSVKQDAEGKDAVKIPTFFMQSVRLRSDLLERLLQAMQLMNDFQHMTAFYEAIVEEVQRESPEAAQRIMERMAKLNEDRGFTIDARVRM